MRTNCGTGAPGPLTIVLRCPDRLMARVRYVFDTLLLAAGVPVVYVGEPPSAGPWLLYASSKDVEAPSPGRVSLAHCPQSWLVFDGPTDIEAQDASGSLPIVLPRRAAGFSGCCDVDFDLVANAFYFLSSWSERVGRDPTGNRQLHANSVFVRLGLPQDIVDRYLDCLLDRIGRACESIGACPWPRPAWPGGSEYALVLSHDVDFIPAGPGDIALQGAKTVMRHVLRQRDPLDAMRAAAGWMRAWVAGRDPYGCVPEIIARERELGVRSSFQVAVGHRHPNDVNYRIEDDRVRDYLRVIVDEGFDLCLHGSYLSTEDPQWYVEEARLLARRLAAPLGSRQHFLSFVYDNLFAAQEEAGIEYDMSIGYPDRVGARGGFSYPYFPYNLREDRPYRVLQISLVLMDVTLRGYMGLRSAPARQVIDACLADLRRKRGCVSAVWHPIVFGGARDPGYGELYFDMIATVKATGGLATDGRTINAFWRDKARRYASFA